MSEVNKHYLLWTQNAVANLTSHFEAQMLAVIRWESEQEVLKVT
jgi:hypothetical protein